MFGKVFKYEMKAVRRILLPLYGAMILVAFLFALSSMLSMNLSELRDRVPYFVDILQVLLSLLFFGGLIACSVVTFVVLARRFYSNFLGNEGYLQLSLPVDIRTHLAARTLSAFIWNLLGGVTACLALAAVILVFSFQVHDLTGIWKNIADTFRYLQPDLPLVILWILTLLANMTAGIERLYLSISIGHLWEGHKLIGSVLAYIGTGFAWSTFSGILTGIVFRDASAPMGGLFGLYGDMEVPGLILTLVLALAQAGIYYGITWIILDRNLNLD